MTIQKLRNALLMLLVSLIVSCLAGISVILFRGLIGFFHNLLFYGKLSFIYFDNIHATPSIFGIGIIFVPVIGGLVVIWIIQRFAQDEKGLSIPEIIYKIRHEEGKIRSSLSLAKAISSAISIGSGASIGREGPAIQIGAAISYVWAKVAGLSIKQRNILIASGIAATTAAIFNAPFTGIVFAIELFLTTLSLAPLALIVVATITALYVKNSLIGLSPIFTVPNIHYYTDNSTLFVYVMFFIIHAALLGLIASLIIKTVYGIQDIFNSVFKNAYLSHSVAMLIIGIMMYLLLLFYGHYYIEGIGFATIEDCFQQTITNPRFLLLLLTCKFIATCLSLGTGASGGIFAPALYMGATFGALFGITINIFFPTLHINAILFILLGMAGVVGTTTGAIWTSIFLVCELTRNYSAIIPIFFTLVIANIVRKYFCKDDVYTLKLVRKGIKP